MPPNIIDKIDKFGKNHKSMSLRTVRGFLKDSKRSKFTL